MPITGVVSCKKNSIWFSQCGNLTIMSLDDRVRKILHVTKRSISEEQIRKA